MSARAEKSATIPVAGQTTIASGELVQRLDALGGKIDVLLAAFGLSERAADVRWHSVAAEKTSYGPDLESATVSQSARTGAQFAALRLQRDALRRDLGAENARTPECEARADAELNPLSLRLFNLAHQLAALPAGEFDELRFKALALQEYCEENSDDVVHLLAASLATDILARGH